MSKQTGAYAVLLVVVGVGAYWLGGVQSRPQLPTDVGAVTRTVTLELATADGRAKRFSLHRLKVRPDGQAMRFSVTEP